MNITDIARKLAPLLGRADELPAIRTHLGMILHGQRSLPKEWEPHLISILECNDRSELAVHFPGIRMKAKENFNPVEVELVVVTPVGSVPEVRLPDVIRALQLLDQFGIKVEIRVRPKAS